MHVVLIVCLHYSLRAPVTCATNSDVTRDRFDCSNLRYSYPRHTAYPSCLILIYRFVCQLLSVKQIIMLLDKVFNGYALMFRTYFSI